MDNFIGSDIELSIPRLHACPIGDWKSVVTDLVTKSCKFICEYFIIHYKSEIFFDNAESFADSVDIGIYNCWVHTILSYNFFTKSSHILIFPKKYDIFYGEFIFYLFLSFIMKLKKYICQILV